MNGESSYQPDFIMVDNKTEGSKESTNNEVDDKSSVSGDKCVTHDNNLSQNDLNFLCHQRNRFRLFDPKGVYTFRNVEISYLQTFFHIFSLLISLLLFIGFYYLPFIFINEPISSLGNISTLTVLDKLFLAFIAVYIIFKLKQGLTCKVAEFDYRYKIALCANSFNLTVLNSIKLSIFFMALDLMILTIEPPQVLTEVALENLQNGVRYDIFSAIAWIFTVLIVVNAFKYLGKGAVK